MREDAWSMTAYVTSYVTCDIFQDVQVPVCPLCNIPIPVKRGQTPDFVVGEHIDRDCKSDPAQQKRKVRRGWVTAGSGNVFQDFSIDGIS